MEDEKKRINDKKGKILWSEISFGSKICIFRCDRRIEYPRRITQIFPDVPGFLIFSKNLLNYIFSSNITQKKKKKKNQIILVKFLVLKYLYSNRE